MGCPYETKAKMAGGIDALNKMLEWSNAMEKDRRATMGPDWHDGYDMALKGFIVKLEHEIFEMGG